MTALDAWCETHGASDAARWEMQEVIHAAKANGVPDFVLEIGAHRGDSFRIWLEEFQPYCAIAVEHEMSPRIYEGLTEFIDAEDTAVIFGDSADTRTVTSVHSMIYGGDFDFLYIDGDHSYAAVKADFEKYAPLVRKGGLIVFDDDHTEPGVRAFTVQLAGRHIKGDGDSGGKFLHRRT